MNMDTVMGPVAYEAHRDKVEAYTMTKNIYLDMIGAPERPW